MVVIVDKLRCTLRLGLDVTTYTFAITLSSRSRRSCSSGVEGRKDERCASDWHFCLTVSLATRDAKLLYLLADIF